MIQNKGLSIMKKVSVIEYYEPKWMYLQIENCYKWGVNLWYKDSIPKLEHSAQDSTFYLSCFLIDS
jgi:hypothetical protein